jgi:PAS domain S-box-containing protein
MQDEVATVNHQDSLGLDTPFDHLTTLLCSQFGVPFSLVSFVHGDLAVFRSEVSVGESCLPRDLSVSNLLVGMGAGAQLVIEDMTLHPVLKNHPMVLGKPFLRFFAGSTVSTRKGEPVGAVGIMDSKPRPALTASELVTLGQVAGIAGRMFDQTTAQRVQSEQLKLLKLAEQMSGVGNWRYDVGTGEVTWSDEVYRIHGYAPKEVEPNCDLVLASYHPEDAQRLEETVMRTLTTGEGYEFELRLRTPDLEERLVVTRAGTEQDDEGRVIALFGVFQDVTEAVRSKERLERSESLFRLMSETATDVIARYDPDGTFRYLSPSVEAVMGQTPDELIGRKCTEFIHPDDLSEICAAFAAGVAAGPAATPLRFEYRALKQDGSVVWLEASPRAVFDANGDLLEFHDHVRDITARKDAERVQTELVETLSMAEELGGVGSWRLDVASGAVTWSDEVYRIHGKSRDSFDPSFDDAVGCYHPDDRQTVADCCREAIETGIGGGFQLRLIREDGEIRTVSSNCRPERDGTGAIVALFGVFQDVTDSIRIHDRIAASETRFRLLADNATDIIATYGMDGVFRYISPAIEGVMGYHPEELVGRPFWRFMHPDDVAGVRSAFAAYAKAGPGAPSPRIPYRGLRKDGQTVWLEAHPKVIRDAAGRALEFQDVVRDVSETKALEDELIAARDVAEAGARTKSEFLANMSHELRTPLTSVIGFSGLLQGSPNLPEAERKYADRIATASEALLSVINDILDYSKLEAEAVDLEPQAFDPRAMAEGAVAIVETQCQAKGLTLETVIDADLPGALMGDEGRLRQVTLNFLSNAVKFTTSGTVRLEVTTAGDRLRLAVTDSGIGIAPDKIDTLFDRFTQADASTTRVYGGTGLGLAISQRLIEMMGGEIGADSRPGEGSTFWFEVPMREAIAGVEAAGADDLVVDAGLKILMADDAAPNRELVTAILGGLGLALETVCNGAEAVEAARTGAYDLILMDVHMPVMDGLDATRAIRAMGGATGRTPIIALTANVQPEQVVRCREAGMDGHVGKPIQISELLAALATASAAVHEGEAVDGSSLRSAGT